MNPTFTEALRYYVKLECLSPLRTGDQEGDLQQILRRRDGSPFLQGSSLAGALRDWRENTDLFGSNDEESAVIISDVNFQEYGMIVRPRLRMDPALGSAKTGGKFDIAALPAGTTGEFHLVWRGKNGMEKAAAAIEEYLSALSSGAIQLGSQKNNGFGRVKLTVRKRMYHMGQEEDLKAWLEGEEAAKAGEEIELSESVSGCVQFFVTAETENLLVKASTGEGVGATGADAVPMTEKGKVIVPGSSVKGAVRAHLGRIAPHLYPEAENIAAEIERLFGRNGSDGDNGVMGCIRFYDGVMEQASKKVKHRIRISRFTGGVMNRGLFSEETVGGTLKFSIRMPEEERAGCMLLLYGLRDLGIGLY